MGAAGEPTPDSQGDKLGWTVLQYGFYDTDEQVFTVIGSVGHSAPEHLQKEKVGQVVVIRCNAVYTGGALRHPRIIRFRDDKRPRECLQPAPTPK